MSMSGAGITAGSNATNDQTGGGLFNTKVGPSIGGSGSLGDWVGRMDPAGNLITKIGGDPLNIYGNRDNPNALLFPSSSAPQTQTAFPNLGAASMIPHMPGGSFGAISEGGGPYNAMASHGAGGLMFNPQSQMNQGQQMQQGGPKPSQGTSNMGGNVYSPMKMNNSAGKVGH